MRIVVILFASIILLFLCALALMWIPLPQSFPPPLSKGRNLMAAIIVGILGLGDLIALTIYVVFSPLQAGRVLDPVLGPAGFTSQGYMIFGRRYTGRYRDKTFDVHYLPSQSSRPAVLDVYVGAETGTRMAIGGQRPLLDCRDCARLTASEPELADLEWFAESESRARSLIGDPQTKAAVIRLIRESPESADLYVQPTRVWFRAHLRQLPEERVWQWFDDISIVASAAELVTQ
jgi:hypothetical protein